MDPQQPAYPPSAMSGAVSLEALRRMAYGGAGARQSPSQAAAQVVDGLRLDARAHARLESALQAWFAGGCTWPFACPVDLPEDMLAQLGATLAQAARYSYIPPQPLATAARGHRMPTAAERLGAAPGLPLVRSEGGASQKADKRPKWKKKGWVGPGGARATAERQGRRAGHGPDSAYTNAIYARMVGKAMTRSGKPIAGQDDPLYRACRAWAARGPRQASQRGAAEALLRSCAGYTAADHLDAAAHHQAAGAALPAWAHAHAAAQLSPGGR